MREHEIFNLGTVVIELDGSVRLSMPAEVADLFDRAAAVGVSSDQLVHLIIEETRHAEELNDRTLGQGALPVVRQAAGLSGPGRRRARIRRMGRRRVRDRYSREL